MDILEIDVSSYAGRVGHVAASEIAGLMKHGEPQPIEGWLYGGKIELAEGTDISPVIEQMADYVLARPTGLPGETLYRRFVGPDWPSQDLPTRLAFNAFASTVSELGTALELLQFEKNQELARPPAGAAPKIEDTIFEKTGSLGDMRPEAQEAAKLIAEHDAAVRAEKKRKAEERKAAKEAERAAAAAEAAKKGSKKPAPMSAGEAPATPPVNRGGRGNKKRAS